MGRAKGGSAVATVGTRRQGVRVDVETCVISVEQLIANGASRADEQVELAGGVFTLTEGESAAALQGLEAIEGVQRLPNGLYRVSTAEGVAMVDLESMSVAHSSSIDTDNTLGALYAAMGYQAMYETDPSTTDPSSPLAELGDAYSAFMEAQIAVARSTGRFADNGEDESAATIDPQLLADLAAAAQTRLQELGGDVTLNSENLVRMLTPAPAPTNPRTNARNKMAQWRQTVRRVQEAAGNAGLDVDLQAARALLFPMDPATGLLGELTDVAEEEYAQAAIDLGCPVPELKIHYTKGVSDGDFEIGSAEKERIDLFRNAICAGDRAFAFRGPPGSGKGELAAQMAAIMKCAFVPINVGPSSDLEQNIGGDGLRAETFIARKPILGPDNKPIIGDDGEPLTWDDPTIVTVSKTLYGPLAEAAQRPCIIEIQEPEGMEQEAIRLHSLLGEKVGEPDMRYLNINSSAAGREISIKVHPECIIVFTYNPGREDVKLKQATHDRCVNLDFDYPTREAEARRLAKMVNRVLMDENNSIPEPLRQEVTPDMMEPFVGIVEKMRHTANENASFIESPGSRTAARMCIQMMMQAFQGDDRSDRTVRLLLDYCRSYDEKFTTSAPDAMVNQILQDELTPLRELGAMWYEQGAPYRDADEGEEVVLDAPKKTAKAKPAGS